MVQPKDGPTVQRMLLGSLLRRLRTDKDISRAEAGESIRASEWKIHRLEKGQVGVKERDIKDLLALYGVTDPDKVTEFVAFARKANARGWWHQYSDVMPQWYRAYVDLEAAASLIRTYDGQLIPGLLRTEDYMRAVIRGAHTDRSPEEVEHWVELHVARQTLLMRPDASRLWAVVDEAALRRPVGGTEVMRAQLERLIEATKLPNVALQILPVSAGAYPAMVGAFTILRFAHEELPDVVFLEHLTGALQLDKRVEVDQYQYAMHTMSILGERRHKTADILGKILEDLL